MLKGLAGLFMILFLIALLSANGEDDDFRGGFV